MFRAEQGDDVDPRRAEQVNTTTAQMINSGLMGYQTDPLAAHQVQTVGEQHLQAGTDARRSRFSPGQDPAPQWSQADARHHQRHAEHTVHRSHLALIVSLLVSVAPGVAAQDARFSREYPAPTPDSLAVERLIDSLPLRARVAQLVMPWIPGSYAAFDDSAYAIVQGWVDSLQVGGIIVSIGSPLDVAMKLNRLQQRSVLPLLIAADLEGGASIRLTGATPFPPNMAVAAAGREEDAYEVGRVTALEGRAVGIHLAFAPVADINNNPANPIINTRSFGEDPHTVGRMVAAAIRGMQDNGLLATAKHFPGHGDTGTDSHLELPVIPASWSRLDTLELVPFRAAIDAGVALVMSGHLSLPQFVSDPHRPATLDPEILTGLLRDSLGFKGIVVTDALDMGGIVNTYGAGEAAVQAFLAGSDLLLMPSDPGQAIAAMTNAVESGRVTYERLERSVRRVLLVKWRLGLLARRTVPLDSIPATVGSARFLAAARSIAERSIVLVADSQGTIDSMRAGPRSVALITYGEENAGSVGNTLARQLRAEGHRVALFRLWPPSGSASFDSARAVIRRNNYTVFAVSVKASASKGTIGIPETLTRLMDETSRRRRAAVVSLGSPYVAQEMKHLRSYLLAWGSGSLSEWAAARALAGSAQITGQLPVRLPPAYPVGHGLMRVDLRP